MNFEELTDYMINATNGDYAMLMQLLIKCIQLMPLQLPPVGAAAITMAKQYWVEHAVPVSELDRARVECWNYLDDRAASTNTTAPDCCAVRAVICVLYAELPSNDVGELVQCFNEMLQAAFNVDDATFVATVGSIVQQFTKHRCMGPEKSRD